MNLNEAQKQRVTAWINEGLQPADIQNRLAAEFGLRLTYMEVRLLLTDLALKPKDKERVAPKTLGAPGIQPPGATSKPARPHRPDRDSRTRAPEAEAGVSITVDQVMRAGAVVSGKVQFSDGKSAEWYLDQFGRLGLVPKETGYKPSQQDLMEFQAILQGELARHGF